MEIPEHDLLQRARQLDPTALAVVFDRYYVDLFRFCYVHTVDQQRAEDLAADVFSRALAAFKEGQGAKTHLRAWLYRIATNLLIDDSRRQKFRQHQLLNDDLRAEDGLPEPNAESAWINAQLISALHQLPDKQRTVIVLRYLHGFELNEIAETLETTVGAVKALQARGFQELRTVLSPVVGQVDEESSDG